MEPRYVKNAGAVFSLKWHIVWCPKYRRKVLVHTVEKRFKKLLYQKRKELGLTIHALDVMPDHVHLFIEHDPTRCVAEIVNRLKKLPVTSCVMTSRLLPSPYALESKLFCKSRWIGKRNHDPKLD